MRLVTWNVNSVRIRLDNLARLASEVEPDVVCLQETKVDDASFPYDEVRELGYRHVAVRGQKGYNGVAVLSRQPFEAEHRLDWWGQDDSRHLSVRFPDAFELHVFYVPSGGPTPDPEKNEKFAHKLGFLTEMAQWARDEGIAGRKLAIVGDLNVAPLDNDVWNHQRIKRQVGHTPLECEHMAALREAGGFTDVGRHFVPPEEFLFTWWGYRHPQSFAKNYGWRLDHVWVTPPLAKHLKTHKVESDARTWPRPSDHVPVTVDFQ
jgi:exodeoxyribonuclease-3